MIGSIKRKLKNKKFSYAIGGNHESIAISNFNIDLRNPRPGKEYITVGKDSCVNMDVCFETEEGSLIIGDKVSAGGVSVICRNKVQIDDNALLAWDILLYDHNSHSFDYMQRRKDIDAILRDKRSGANVLKFESKDWTVVYDAPIHICSDAWIGEGVTILSGVTIGEGAIIGAGSVVRESIPAWAIAYGNPCRVVAENRFKPN